MWILVEFASWEVVDKDGLFRAICFLAKFPPTVFSSFYFFQWSVLVSSWRMVAVSCTREKMSSLSA